MNSRYYSGPTPYRGRSPVGDRTPPSQSDYQHYSSSPLEYQHYSPPGNARPRTPSNHFSPLTDRGNYDRYSEPSIPTRSLPWQSRSPAVAPSPRHQECRERDRYREPTPGTSSGRGYDYPSSREEVYYTQAQAPYPSHSVYSPPTHIARASSSVVDSEYWSRIRYSPRRPQPLMRSRDRYDDIRRSGTREAPICVENFYDQRIYRNNRGRDAREDGAGMLIDEEWRIPAWEHPSPRSWKDRDTSRRRSLAHERVQETLTQYRHESRELPSRGEGIERRYSGSRWDVRGRAEDLPTSTLPPASHEERFNSQPVSRTQPSPTSPPLRRNEAFPPHEPQPFTEPLALEQSVRERAAVNETEILLKQKEEEQSQNKRELEQITLEEAVAARVVKESQSRVQMLEARQRQTPKSPAQTPQKEFSSPQQLLSQVTQPHSQQSVPSKANGVVQQPQVIGLTATEDEEPPWKKHKAPINGNRISGGCRSRRPELKGSNVTAQLTKSPTRGSVKVKVRTKEEDDRLLEQMSKENKEILFPGQKQTEVISQPPSVAPLPVPPGLNLIQQQHEISAAPVAEIPPEPAESPQPAEQGVATPPLAKVSPAPMPQTHSESLHSHRQTSSGVSAEPKLSALEDTRTKTILQSTVAVSLVHDPSSKPEDPPRRRGNSIASSISSHNSRLSSSRFLNAALTSGTCIVCSEKDIPPLNRLAKCFSCSLLYHQSCHTPLLTKAILEGAGENWICSTCKSTVAEKAEDRERETNAKKDGDRTAQMTRPRTSGLGGPLKANDGKTLEEHVMTNKSLWSSLLKRHQQWKSPTSERELTLTRDGLGEGVSYGAEPSMVEPINFNGGHKRARDCPAQVETSRWHRSDRCKLTASIANSSGRSLQKPTPAKTSSISHIGKPVHTKASFLKSATARARPVEFIPSSISPANSLSINRTTQSQVSDQAAEWVLQEILPGKAVPSIKPAPQAIPASQSSEPAQGDSNVGIEHPSPFNARLPNGRKRELLIISDSEEGQPSPKKAKLSPKAAMKSAPSAQEPTKSLPLKSPSIISGAAIKTTKAARKRSIVAKKSATKHCEPEPPVEDQTVKGKETETQRGTLRSPISPLLSSRANILHQPSPLPTARPTDQGLSQEYSLRVILTASHTSNDATVVIDDQPSTFTYTSPYPLSLSRPCPSTLSPSPQRNRSRDKKNFDILSLVPNDPVPVLEEGKLAFREGVIDLKTGHLKRGARKFKVGKLLNGETIY